MTPSPRPPRWLAPTGFVVPLALYTLTAARTVQGGDSGEFGLIGMTGGVPHPPGYPLYALLARAIGLLPINPPFFRIALLSALCGAGAVAIIQATAWRLTSSVPASLLTAFVFAVSAIQWRLSGIPEVFALHALLVSTAMYLTVRIVQEPEAHPVRDSALLGLTLGLGLSNHMTTVFCAPLALAALVSVRWSIKPVSVMVLAVLIGLTPYLLLLVWGRLDRSSSWLWGDTTTASGLISHMLRKDFGTLTLTSSSDPRTTYWLGRSLVTLAKGYNFFFAAGVIGAVVGVRKQWAFSVALLSCLALAGAVFPLLCNIIPGPIHEAVVDRFFLMPAVLFAPLVAWGIAEAVARVNRRAFVAVLAAIAVAAAVRTYPSVNWRADSTIERYLVASVSNLPKNSVVLGFGDGFGPGYGWVSRVLHVRPDVHCVDVILLGYRWYYDRIARETPGFPLEYSHQRANIGELGRRLAAQHPTFVIPRAAEEGRQSVGINVDGLLYRVESGQRRSSLADMKSRLDQDCSLLGDLPDPIDAWSTEARTAVVMPWKEVIAGLDAAGDKQGFESAVQKASEYLPPESN